MSQEPLVGPFFGIARPLLAFLVAVFGWFADSHPLFRWIFSLGQALHVFGVTYVFVVCNLFCFFIQGPPLLVTWISL